MTNETVIKTDKLTKRFGDFIATNEITFEVYAGEIFGFLGANGAGKTTAMKMLCGLSKPSSGNATIAGFDIYKQTEEIKKNIGYMSQRFSLYNDLTVAENIQAVLELQNLTKPEIAARLEELLGELGIEHLRDNTAISLSGGERRRCEIARALATAPRLILLDEPFAGVDPIAVIDIQKIIRFLKEKGIGVLITDHNVRETLGICDRAFIINAGEVLASGRPDEIVRNEQVRQVYLGEHFRL
mgnify:CR=1 FL=1